MSCNMPNNRLQNQTTRSTWQTAGRRGTTTMLALGLLMPGLLLSGLSGGGAVAHAQARPDNERPLRGLERPELAGVRSELEQLRRENPEIFVRVEATRQQVIEADRRKRGRLANTKPLFRSLGPEALLPMLHALATDDPLTSGMLPSAWTAYRAGMIDAVGHIGDMRAFDVLYGIAAGPDNNPTILRAASEAIGRLGSQDALDALLALAAKPGPRQSALIAGLGTTRQIPVARFLVAHLETTRDAESARAAIEALGSVANSWAWQTPTLARSGSGEEVRALAARALVAQFARSDARLHEDIIRALLVVDHPSTPQFIQQARKEVAAEVQQALDSLEERLARNPLRR